VKPVTGQSVNSVLANELMKNHGLVPLTSTFYEVPLAGVAT